MKNLERLIPTEDYFFYFDSNDAKNGSLVLETEEGDTLLPPFEGKFSILDSATSKSDALKKARSWKLQSKQPKTGRPPLVCRDLTERKTVTLRASTWAKIEAERQDRESVSACLDRIVSKALKCLGHEAMKKEEKEK